jgi:uncharacterized cupredoxin-like copper-binding protein
MKRIALISILAGIMVLVTACGGSAPAATQAPVQPTAAEVPTQPAATEAPAQPSSTQASSASNAATEVDVTLADNTIQSSLTTFKVGVPYTFVVKNTGHHAHNFNISTPVSIAGSLDAAASSALVSVDQNQLAVGATATVQYTFLASAAGTQLEFSCLIKRHYEDGMKLAITVAQ